MAPIPAPLRALLRPAVRRLRGTSSAARRPRFRRLAYGVTDAGFWVEAERSAESVARSGQLTGVLLRGRFFGAERVYQAEPGAAIRVIIPAADLTAFAEDVIDLYATRAVLPAADPAGDPEDSAERAEIRLGRAEITERQHDDAVAVGDGWARIGRTVNNNLSIRTEGTFASAVRSKLLRRTTDPEGETLEYEISSSNDPVRGVDFLIVGRSTQTTWVCETDLQLDADASRSRGSWVYRMSVRLDLGRVCREASASEEIVDVNYALDLGAERIVRKGVYPSAAAYGRSRYFAQEVADETVRLTPYETFRSRRVAYRVERFEPGAHQLLRMLSRTGWALAPLRLARQIWLVGEVPYKAQDNGLAFFRYAARRRPGRVFYVIRDDVADATKIPTESRVRVGSKQHVWLSVLASRLVGSHHAEYLLASRDDRFVRSCRGVRIFLQHGVTAMKNVVPNYGRLRSPERPTEKFLVVSEAERRIVVEDFGYRPEQVPVVGFARFDTLFEPVEVEPRILIMPTWRDSLKTDDTFLDSDYYRNWDGVLQHARGLDGAAEQGYTVTLLLHPNMRPFARHFQDAGVEVLDLASADVQLLLRTSAVLVTDFSSVAWDFAFLHKPVVYFQFDLAKLTGKRAPHIDFATDLPGAQCFTPDQVWEQISLALADGCRMAPEYLARADRFIAHRDQENCSRIYDVVRRPGVGGVLAERFRTNRSSQRLWSWYRKSDWYYPTQLAAMRLLQLLPSRRTVLFEADRGSHFSDSPRAIYEALLGSDFDGDFVWVDNVQRRHWDRRTRKIRRNTPAYFRALARSRWWVTNQNFRDGVVPRGDQTYLQTWHGTPLKRMQFDVEEMQGRAPDYREVAMRQTGAWSALLSPSPYATRCFRSAFAYEGEVLELGYPRNDVLSRVDPELVSTVRRTLGIAQDDERRLVLYAPTFRDDMRRGLRWRHRLALDLDTWVEEFGADAILILRLHPLVKFGRIPEEVRHAVVDGTDYADIQELMVASDVLVTDYSSVFFDYALLWRPMVFYAYDLDHYENDLRGFYLPYADSVPGPVVRTEEELKDAVRAALDGAGDLAGREEFLATYAPMDDGSAAARVVERVFSR